MAHGKIGLGGKFDVADVRQLPGELRADPVARELVMANKDVAQAEVVLARASKARDGLNEKIAKAEADLAAAKERQAKAVAAAGALDEAE